MMIDIEIGKALIEILVMLLVSFFLGILANLALGNRNKKSNKLVDEKQRELDDLIAKHDELLQKTNHQNTLNEQLNIELNLSKLSLKRMDLALNQLSEKELENANKAKIEQERELNKKLTSPTIATIDVLPFSKNEQPETTQTVATNIVIEDTKLNNELIENIEKVEDKLAEVQPIEELNINHKPIVDNVLAPEMIMENTTLSNENTNEIIEEKLPIIYKETDAATIETNKQNQIDNTLVNEIDTGNLQSHNEATEATTIDTNKQNQIDNTIANEIETSKINAATDVSNTNFTNEKTENSIDPLDDLLKVIGRSNQEDDLKNITGIGPFIEQKLYDLDVKSYLQISKLDASNIEVLNELIQFFPGRIERDKWVEQAKALISE
jgi:predicted flap endonuclease-1-like 5' DNA nuclease